MACREKGEERMRLIFIYGAPAVGKLTVAKELSKITGYKLFHNHLTLDLVETIFNSNEAGFWELVNKLRLKVFEITTRSKLKGLIFTYGDIASDNFSFVKKVIKIIEKNKGKIYIVYLFCNEKELFKRVTNSSRKKFEKTLEVKKLKQSLSKWDFHTTFPSKPTLQINNTSLSARRVAQKIKEHYKL